MPDRPGRRTSVYLPADLADRIAATDLPLARIIARGLDCTGHAGTPADQLRQRIEQIEQRQAATDKQLRDHQLGHPIPCTHTDSTDQWARHLDDLGPFTAVQAATAWNMTEHSARRRIRKLAAAGYLTELLPERKEGHRGGARRWETRDHASE